MSESPLKSSHLVVILRHFPDIGTFQSVSFQDERGWTPIFCAEQAGENEARGMICILFRRATFDTSRHDTQIPVRFHLHVNRPKSLCSLSLRLKVLELLCACTEKADQLLKAKVMVST